jgi:2-dehydropantoate 2-reductase
MRIGIVGAGGVGGLLAGLLSRAGHEVAVVARGEALELIRARGLHVESPLGVFTARVEAGTVADLAPVEALFVTVKTWQVREVVPTLAPLLRPDGIVVPLENGVDAPDECAVSLGATRAYGGICHVLSWLEGPGVVKHIGDGIRVTLGAWRAPVDARVEALQRALSEAGVAARITGDFSVALWDKFVFIASFGGVGAVTRAGAGPLRTLPETRRLLAGAFDEVCAVAQARGVGLRSETAVKAMTLIDTLPADAIASLQRDIVSGRPSELEALSGAIARLGAELGVPVPIHTMVYASLLPQEQAARARSTRRR